LEVKQIKAFIDAMASSDLAELEASKDGWTLRLVRRAADRSAVRGSTDRSPSSQRPLTRQSTSASADEPGTDVRAPLYGLVYLSPSPEAPPFVVTGQAVKTGDTLCVIEAMKVFNNICAEQDGIVEIVVTGSGSEVEAGQLLMRIV
jgi:acetyl-CoA carboxylase biotin carboxyl carrier protein